MTKLPLFTKAKNMFDVPMVVLAFVLLFIIIIREIYLLSPEVLAILEIVDWVIWAAFVLEIFVMTSLAENKLVYLVKHWYDVFIVLIPSLRVLRIVSIVSLPVTTEFAKASLVSLEAAFGTDNLLVRVVPLVFKGSANIKHFIKKHRFDYVFAALLVIVLFLGSLVSIFEAKVPGSRIRTVQDGIWWSVETITTVGYGDTYPITVPGKIVAVLLMAFGITTFSLLTANIATHLIGEKDEDTERKLIGKIEELEKKIDRLEDKLDAKNKHQMRL